MSPSPISPIKVILLQLSEILEGQKNYLSPEQDFEDMNDWDRLALAWDEQYSKLHLCLRQTELLDEDRNSIQQLVDVHQLVCSNIKTELIKLKEQISLLQKNNKVRGQYEVSTSGSVFYDQRK